MANCFSACLNCMGSFSLAFMRIILLISCIFVVLAQLIGLCGLYMMDNEFADVYPGLEPGFSDYALSIGLLVLGLIGCHGAYTKNPNYLKAFAFIITVSAISHALFGPGSVKDEWRERSKTFYDRMTEYAQDYEFHPAANKINKATESWDLLQRSLLCCGLNTPKDWTQKWKLTEKNALPKSCCLFMSRAANHYSVLAGGETQCTLAHAFDVGCYDRLDHIVESSARNVYLLALVDFCLAAFALLLARQSEHELESVRVPGDIPQYQRFDGSVYVRQTAVPQVGYTKQPPVAPPLYPDTYGVDRPPKYERT